MNDKKNNASKLPVPKSWTKNDKDGLRNYRLKVRACLYTMKDRIVLTAD